MKKNISKNEGFTLIEIIISIAILTIVMVPMLSSYVMAAKVNRQAQIYQKAATLGQNIVESIKTKNIEEIALMFNGVGSFQIVNSNLTGVADCYGIKSYDDGGYGEYIDNVGGYILAPRGTGLSSIKLMGTPPIDTFNPPVGRGTFLFGIENILDGSSEFDALVTLDATTYRDTVKYPGSMNNYKMPDLIELNQNEVSILDMEGFTTSWSDETVSATYDNSRSFDKQAFEYFINIQLSYLVYIESLLVADGLPTPTPVVVYSEDNIKEKISKDIQISLQKDDARNTIQVECKVVYTCDLDLNGDGSSEITTYEVYTQNNPIPADSEFDRHIYLFYTPSDFERKDKVSVINNDARVKLMIAKQDGTPVTGILINKTDINSANTLIYTNLSAGDLDASSLSGIAEHMLISKGDAQDRIYNIKVTIYKAGSIASGSLTEPYATFTSTREEK